MVNHSWHDNAVEVCLAQHCLQSSIKEFTGESRENREENSWGHLEWLDLPSLAKKQL